MLKKSLLLAALTSMVIPLAEPVKHQFANAAAPYPAVTDDLLASQTQADFELMRRALEEAHPGLYRYSTKSEMDRSFDALRAKLNRPMSKSKFMAVVAEALGAIRCGHTNVKPDDQLQATMNNALKFPLRLLVEEKRLSVVFNDTPDDRTIQPEMETLEINGRGVADILRQIFPLVPTDGDIETHKRAELGDFANYYWLAIEQTSDFTIKAKDQAGKVVTTTLHGVTDADRKNNHNPVNATMQAGIGKVYWSHENLSLRFLTDPQIAEISIRRFLGDDYPKWIESTFKTLSEKKTQTLIIDLRGCHGGDDMYCAMLVSYLTDKQFRFYDHINVKTITPSFQQYTDLQLDDQRLARYREGMTPNPAGGYFLNEKGHAGLPLQAPGKYPFHGKVFVLISGESFSGAADFSAVAHHLKLATFIGEETGGAYYGNNSGMMPTLTLPNSKLQIRLPMYEYWNAVPGYAGKRRGTVPDHVMPLTVSDLLRGVDGGLDLAIKLATTK